MNNEQLKSKSF